MRLRNQSGSVMIMVLVIAVVFAGVVMDLSSRFVSTVEAHQKFSVSNENIRVADELSKVVARAYEYGMQTQAAGACTSPKVNYTINGMSFCFSDPATDGNCVKSKFNTGQKVCLDVTVAPTAYAEYSPVQQIRFTADYKFTPSPGSRFLKWMIPPASADIFRSAMPPIPTGLSHAFTDYTCGSGTDPALCQKCGPGTPNICYELSFCPADKTGCTAAQKIKIDMMIARRELPAANCPAQAFTWTIGANTCTANAPSTAPGASASVSDYTAPKTGAASFACLSSGAWNATALPGASCTTGATALCWVANTATPGQCAPVGSGCTAAGLTKPGVACWQNTGGGNIVAFYDTMTCTSVASISNPICQTKQNTYYCFTAGTEVTMADGSRKKIESINVGDYVQTRNIETGRNEPNRVLVPIHHPKRLEKIFTLTLENGSTIETNGEHRFYDQAENQFLAVGNLVARFRDGGIVHFLGDDDRVHVLVSARERTEFISLYNLTVDQQHNYFAGGVLVHNEKALCKVQTAAQCTGLSSVCTADYTPPRFYKCPSTSPSVRDALNACLAVKPNLCP